MATSVPKTGQTQATQENLEAISFPCESLRGYQLQPAYQFVSVALVAAAVVMAEVTVLVLTAVPELVEELVFQFPFPFPRSQRQAQVVPVALEVVFAVAVPGVAVPGVELEEEQRQSRTFLTTFPFLFSFPFCPEGVSLPHTLSPPFQCFPLSLFNVSSSSTRDTLPSQASVRFLRQMRTLSRVQRA